MFPGIEYLAKPIAELAVELRQWQARREYFRDRAAEIFIKQVEEVQERLSESLLPWMEGQVEAAASAVESGREPLLDLGHWTRELIDIALPHLALASFEAAEEELELLGIAERGGPSGGIKSTASDWLEDEEEELPASMEVPGGGVIGLATERPAWMAASIARNIRQQFRQDYWNDIPKTTLRDIERIVERGVLEGQSVRAIAGNLREVLGEEYTNARITNIVRTETGNALNAGRKAVHDKLLEELPPEVAREVRPSWLSVLARTTRDAHAMLHGVVADADGMWNLNGIRIPYPAHWSLPPGDRCNCMCTTVMDFGVGHFNMLPETF